MGFLDDLKKAATDAQQAVQRGVDNLQKPAGPPEPPPLDGAALAPPPLASAPPVSSEASAAMPPVASGPGPSSIPTGVSLTAPAQVELVIVIADAPRGRPVLATAGRRLGIRTGPCQSFRFCGCSVSPRPSIATNSSMRRARVAACLAPPIRNRIA